MWRGWGWGVFTPEISIVFNNAARVYRDNIISQSTGKEINRSAKVLFSGTVYGVIRHVYMTAEGILEK